MSNKSNNLKYRKSMLKALALPLFGILAISLPASAQSYSLYGTPGTNTLRAPLVPGANYSLPGIPSTLGAAPPPGSGLTPIPVTPGMIGPASLIPWTSGVAGTPFSLPTNQVVIPANQIDQPVNQISLPLSNTAALPPGLMNTAIGGVIPHAPSTPGADPGMLRPPSFNNGATQANSGQNQESAGILTTIDKNGQLPDELTGERPNQRNARQGSAGSGLPGSADFGLRRTIFGYRLQGTNTWAPQTGSSTYNSGLGVRALQAQGQLGSKLSPQISFDSTHKTNFVGAQVTNDLYGIPMINKNKITTKADGTVSPGPPPAPLNTIATQ